MKFFFLTVNVQILNSYMFSLFQLLWDCWVGSIIILCFWRRFLTVPVERRLLPRLPFFILIGFHKYSFCWLPLPGRLYRSSLKARFCFNVFHNQCLLPTTTPSPCHKSPCVQNPPASALLSTRIGAPSKAG